MPLRQPNDDDRSISRTVEGSGEIVTAQRPKSTRLIILGSSRSNGPFEERPPTPDSEEECIDTILSAMRAETLVRGIGSWEWWDLGIVSEEAPSETSKRETESPGWVH